MLRLLLLTAACLAPALAHAADADADAQEPIIVTGVATGYRAPGTFSATRTDTPLIDVPQSLSIVTRKRIEDQAFRTLGEVLRYTPGVSVGQGEGNRDQVTIRGQNTTADFFTDGMRDDIQYFRPLYNLERVEVLKGPNALIFGRGGGGGVINRVQKTPLDALALSGEVIADTFGDALAAGDINLPVSAAAAVRLNGYYETLDNHRDFFEGDRFAINPYFAVEAAPGWTLGLSYEHLEDDRVTDRGVLSFAGAPLRGFRDRFFGIPGVNRTTFNGDVGRARLDAALTPALRWSSALVYGDYDKSYTNVFANGPATSPTGTVPLDSYTDPTARQNFFAQTNLVWKVATGPVAHTVLAGFEYADQRTRNSRVTGVLSSRNLSLVTPVFPSVAFTVRTNDRRSKVEVTSAYGQDQLAFGEHVELVLGVRYDRFEIRGTDFIPDPDRPFARTDEVVSPRLGLVLKPRANLSVYGSYVESFLPRSGDQFTTLSVAQENLAPEKSTNYEGGVKWDIRPELSATLAIFRLDRTNTTTPDPANPALTINVGATRTEGVEAALTGRVLPNWQASAAYTYQDAHLDGNSRVRLAQVPEHQFSLWNRYDVTKRFGLGLGVIHQSSQFAAIRVNAATTRLPAFTRVDAALFARLNERLEAQVNIENLFDTTYFPDAHNNNNISTGAPVNARFTLRARY